MIDLHTHSKASDGTDTPSAVLNTALQNGLSAIALTDHDTFAGLPEFMQAACGKNIIAIPGVEISSMHHYKEIHIIGLFIDPSCTELKNFLAKIRTGREKRNLAMLERLNAMGYKITEKELHETAEGGSPGRPHIARILVAKGYCESIQDAFDRCLRRGARAYIPRTPVPPCDSIRAIHAAHGLAFWAHPIHSQGRMDRSMVRRFLRDMVKQGLDGLEVFYPGYSERQTRILQECGDEHGLLYSGGSDYHGEDVRPGVQIGRGDGTLNIPDEILTKMQERTGKYQ